MLLTMSASVPGERALAGDVYDSIAVTGDRNRIVIAGENGDAGQPVRKPWNRKQAAQLLFRTGISAAPTRATTWLRPDSGIVPIQHRPELDHLLEWCRGGELPRVRLVSGPGGQGKTQLALQIVRILTGQQWLAGFVDLSGRTSPGSETAPQRWLEITAAMASRSVRRSRVLLVVDYAENEVSTLRRLLPLLRECESVRLLLLARYEHNWWRELVDDHAAAGLVDPHPVRLRSLMTELPPHQVRRVYAEAVQCFALRLADPSVNSAALSAGRPSATEFETTLDLYASALLRVLDAQVAIHGQLSGRTEHGDDPVADVLLHEYRHVHRVLRSAGLNLSEHDRDLALAAPFLMPASTLDDAARVLAALPLTSPLTERELRRLAQELGRLYPDTGGAVWAPPRPDRLADAHLLRLARRASSDRDWVATLVAFCGGAQANAATRIVQVLLRCLTVATVENSEGRRRVEHSFVELLNGFPLESLRPVTLFGTTYVPDVYEPDFALSLNTLAIRLSDVGRAEEALAAAQQAVEIRRRLAERTPAVYEPDFALSLNTLAIRLSDVGRAEEALVHAKESTRIYLELAEHDPDIYEPDLALSLNTLAIQLSQLGRSGQALTHASHAVEIHRTLIEHGPGDQRSEFIRALAVLGTLYRIQGNIGPALEVLSEAAGHVVSLALARPVVFCDLLRSVLTDFADLLDTQGQAKEAADVRARRDEFCLN
jgi:tetratricopeptide (TPR) repeat protein